MTEATSFNDKVPPVEVDGLSKEYRTGRNRVTALNNVSITIKPNEFVAFMGSSGSGKSTLLHLMAGLTEPTAGAVKIDGVDLFSMNDSAKTRFRLKNIGIVFQAFNLIPTLTAEENILLPAQIDGKTVAQQELDELLDVLEIKERRKHRPDSLSGGEQQRVAIGRSLIMNPALILADEPTGNLDSVNGERFCKLLRNLCDTQKRTIVLVTHDPKVAEWGDRRVVLKDGKVVETQDALRG